MGLREVGIFVIALFVLLSGNRIFSQKISSDYQDSQWADSVLSIMSLEAKIGQLIMTAAYSNQNESYYDDLEKIINEYHIGGLIFFQGNPEKQFELTRRFQENSTVPLWIAMDAEWGLNMRLEGIKSMPRQMTLGAVQDNRIVYNYAAEVARQCRILGVNINFAPVLDVNNNAANPVINVRSFGENPENVAAKGIAYMNGLQENGVMAVGKHFPGHGDTKTDSHYALPLIPHSRSRLDSIELLPFKKNIKKGIDGIMVAHLNIPGLDNQKNQSASLSDRIITDLLKHEMDFNGIVFTDALNMKAVTADLSSGELALKAYLAGNDILLMPVNIPEVVNALSYAVSTGIIDQETLDKKVKKILEFKKRYIKYETPGNAENSLETLINRNIPAINQQVFEKAVTLVKNRNKLIPFHLIDTISFASLSVNSQTGNEFQEMLDFYTEMDHYKINEKIDGYDNLSSLLDKLSSYEVVLVALHNISNYGQRNYNISNRILSFLQQLDKTSEVVVIDFGIPYSLKSLTGFDYLICGFEDNKYSWQAVPQILFGAIPARGKLPVSISASFQQGHGFETQSLKRLSYKLPDRLGFDIDYFSMIDKVIEDAIEDEAMPGCQVLIAKSGNIVFNKSYGFYTYRKDIPVSDHSLYDLASVTKIAGSIQAIMMLYDKGLIDLDKKISYYLEDLKNSNKEDMIIRDILTHQAGLFPYFPFWKRTIRTNEDKKLFYSNIKTKEFSVEITPNLFTRPQLKDSLWTWIIESDLIDKENTDKPFEYKYSDMGFYIIQKLIEEISRMPLDVFLNEFIYDPIGITYMTYLPKEKFSEDMLVPAEDDRYFRKDIIQGNVHDEIASIYGGIAGHAGLFSNATELSKIMQMNLQGGYYGGIRYFQPETIRTFTSQQYKNNRRGLGWDKPQIIGDEYNPATYFASEESFGHSGFTGTYVWVDPEYELIYIFLSNRSFPDADNRKLIDQDVRKRIQTIIYNSIIKF